MADWASGYVVDIEYTHGFYKELAPARLGFMGLLHGIKTPGLEIEPLTYCELGCGQGLTTNLLAAANPHIEFHATDFNPSHVVGAKALARSAKLPNIHFYDASFEEFLAYEDLPAFDFISLHGIYSWVSPENQRVIVEFIRRKLKPGGVVYVSYNSMPGWAAVMPLRRLLAEHASRQKSKAIPVRIGDALAFLDRLAQAGSSYFAHNKRTRDFLGMLKTKDRKYIAHEYLNEESRPCYFMDIVKEFSEAKLTWIGSARVSEIFDDINLSPEEKEILQEIDDTAFRETVRDHIVNQQFRQDIFVKGPIKLSAKAADEAWLTTRFILSKPKESALRLIQGRQAKIELREEPFQALLSAMEGGARTLQELMNNPSVSKLNLASVKHMLTLLVSQNVCQPCLPAHGEEERSIYGKQINLAIAEHTKSNNTFRYLASGVTGSAFEASRIQQLIWLGLHRQEQDLAEFVLSILKESGQRMLDNGKPLQTDTENIAKLRTYILDFEQKIAPVWRSACIMPQPMQNEVWLKEPERASSSV